MTLQLQNIDRVPGGTAQSKALSDLDHKAAEGLYGSFFKRALDIFLVAISLPVILPTITLLALCLLLQGTLPFYSQKRIGRNGEIFRIWKLRTMVRNASAELERHLEANPTARHEWDSTQKLKNDPRITRFGRILRKTSLDELPQLWNVINGTMSLVGPRPILPEQEKYYYGSAYYRMRPGITGYWQISDRNNCSFVGRVAHDEEYYRNLSLKNDVKTLKKTVSVVLRATGH